MHTHSKLLITVAIAVCTALSPVVVEAQGRFSLGRSLSEVSAPDREAMTRARIAVLDKMQPGSVSAWSDKDTGHSGQVELQRIYENNGMTCGDLAFVLKTPETRRFQSAFCRGVDGTWRLAS